MITKALVWCDVHHQIEEWYKDIHTGWLRYSRIFDGDIWYSDLTGSRLSLDQYLKKNKELKVLYRYTE